MPRRCSVHLRYLRPLALVVALAQLGCAAEERPPTQAPEGSADATPAVVEGADEAGGAAPTGGVVGDEAFVLLWFDASLHRSPGDGAPLIAYDFGETPRERRPGQVFVGRELETRGPWVKVGGVNRWIDEELRPFHCIGSDIVAAPGVDIALWVHERDLAPVLTEPFARRYADGTSVELNPGVPVVGGAPWVDGFTLPVAPPPASIGRRYRPRAPGPRSAVGTSMIAARAFVATLGGAPVRWSKPVWDYSELELLAVTEESGGGHHVIVERCGRLELGFEGEHEALPPGGALGMLAGAEQRPGGAVAVGTPLLWPDGTPAGSVVEELRRVDLAPGAAATTCFEVGVGRELKAEGFRGTTVEVCVETAKIAEISL